MLSKILQGIANSPLVSKSIVRWAFQLSKHRQRSATYQNVVVTMPLDPLNGSTVPMLVVKSYLEATYPKLKMEFLNPTHSAKALLNLLKSASCRNLVINGLVMLTYPVVQELVRIRNEEKLRNVVVLYESPEKIDSVGSAAKQVLFDCEVVAVSQALSRDYFTLGLNSIGWFHNLPMTFNHWKGASRAKGQPGKDKRMLILASVQDRKGYSEIKRLAPLAKGYKFYWAGRDLRRRFDFDESELPDCIEHLGPIDHVWRSKILDSFDAMLIPSKDDPFPLAATEAILGGMPLVASVKTGHFRDGVEGPLYLDFETIDPQEFCAAVSQYLATFDGYKAIPSSMLGPLGLSEQSEKARELLFPDINSN